MRTISGNVPLVKKPSKQRRHIRLEGRVYVLAPKNREHVIHEFTTELLAVGPLAHAAPLVFKKRRTDARALLGRNAVALPRLAALPRLVPPSPGAKGRREGDEPATADGEHGPRRRVEFVEDSAGLVYEQQVGRVSSYLRLA